MKQPTFTKIKQAMICAFIMNPPELKAVMEKVDDLSDDLKALYTEKNGKFELTGIKDVKTQADIDRLQLGITKERENTRIAKEKLAKFGDLNPDEVHTKLDRYDELELAAAGKLDDKKINEIVESRIKSRTAPIERERDQLKAKNSELTVEIEKHLGTNKNRTIKDEVRTAAGKSKVLETAMEDVMLLAERVFEVTEDGKIIAKDGVGTTPGIDVSTWLQEMAEKRPHWWPVSEGGGGRGGRTTGFSNNPWTDEFWSMTEQGKLYKQNPAKAEQMAKSAGTTIGGKRPLKKS